MCWNFWIFTSDIRLAVVRKVEQLLYRPEQAQTLPGG
jgi:hypothetical protein